MIVLYTCQLFLIQRGEILSWEFPGFSRMAQLYSKMSEVFRRLPKISEDIPNNSEVLKKLIMFHTDLQKSEILRESIVIYSFS